MLLVGLGGVDTGDAVMLVVALAELGAARMLWPQRAEIDVPDRARVLMRPRTGRVLLEHAIVPTSVTVCGAALGASASGLAGHPDAAVALVAVVVAPVLTLCAAISARRGGRLPQSVLVTALAADPSGGGIALIGWLTWWPSAAVVVATAPVALGESGAPVPAVIGSIATAAILTWLASRDLDTTAK